MTYWFLKPTNGMDAPTYAASQCAKVEMFTDPLEHTGAYDIKVTTLESISKTQVRHQIPFSTVFDPSPLIKSST